MGIQNRFASETYVQEEIIKAQLNSGSGEGGEGYDDTELRELIDTKANKSEVFSGDYNDLTNKPIIPTKTSQLTNDSNFLTSIPGEYVTETELGNKGYAKQVDVDKLSQEIADQREQINGKQPMGNYATKDDVLTSDEILSMGFVTESWVKAKIEDLKAQGLQQVPLFANTIDECTDTTKLYVLPDGYFYAYMLTTTSGLSIKNWLLNENGELDLQVNKRWSYSSGSYSSSNGDGMVTTTKIPVSSGQVVRVNKNFLTSNTTGYTRIHYFDSSGNILTGDAHACANHKITEENGILSWVVGYQNTTQGDNNTNTLVSNHKAITHMVVSFNVSFGTATTLDAVSDLILTIDEPIEESIVESYQWENTGFGFPFGTDYEERIIELERKVKKLDDVSSNILTSSLSVNEVFAPSPQLPADGSETSDFNADLNVITCNHIYEYLEPLLTKYHRYITKETMGKDESGKYDWNRYVLCRRTYDAWQKKNYPKMYAWVNGSEMLYSKSVSPRIGDTLYTTQYIGTAKGNVSDVNNANQSRTVGGVVYTRDKNNDIEPTLVYTQTCHSPYYVSMSTNQVYDNTKNKIASFTSMNNGEMTDSNGVSYIRYPLGDRNSKFETIPVIVIGSNEHGTGGDPAEPAIISARMMKDLCECINTDNPFLNLLKNEYMIVFCPVINPWGFSAPNKNYCNSNNVNIDRNFDTVGWYVDTATTGGCGEYGGSENETQYFMNTLVESKTKIAMANHGLGQGIDASTGESANAGKCCYMFGRNQTKYTESLLSIAEVMCVNYNLYFGDMGQAPPENYAKTRSYIDSIGAEGGAIEMQSREGFILAGEGIEHTARILEANYTLLLQFLFMLIDKQE